MASSNYSTQEQHNLQDLDFNSGACHALLLLLLRIRVYTACKTCIHQHSFLDVSSSATPFTITLTWDPPKSPIANGIIIAYEVSYWPTGNPQDITRINTTNVVTTLTVQADTRYAITVRAFTREGAGESSSTIIETTLSPPRKCTYIRLPVKAVRKSCVFLLLFRGSH